MRTPEMFEAAAGVSDGLLQYKRGKAGSYNNDRDCLSYFRPDSRGLQLEVVIIGVSRAQWRLVAPATTSDAGMRWLTLDELRDASAFIEARILDLIDHYGRGAETMSGAGM